MKHFLRTAAFAGCFLGTVFPAAGAEVIPLARQSDLSIAIYNDDIALVDDVRTVSLKPGYNQISFEGISDGIIPESALLSGLGIQTLEQNFDYDLITRRSLLEKSIGSTVILRSVNPQTGEIYKSEGKLIALDTQPILEIDGEIIPHPEGTVILKSMPEGLIASPSLKLSVNSENPGEQPLSLKYLTQGLSWEADYVASLNENETNMNLNGFITLNNQSSAVFKDATVRLVSGEISLVARPRSRDIAADGAVTETVLTLKNMRGAMPAVENVADFYIYSLPYKTTVSPKQTKQVALLSKNLVPIQKEYVFDNTLKPGAQPVENRKATVFYTFDNTKENKLGTALPKGTVRFYKNMRNGDSVFVGETHLTHTPNQAHVRLKMSKAFDIFANAKRTKYETFGKNASVAEYEVRLKNGSDELKSVSVYENFHGNWKITSASHPYTSETANRVLWKLDVPAEGEILLKYTVQINE